MPELNDDQTREVNRADKLLQYLDLDENKDSWSAYPPFNLKVNALISNVALLLSKASIKETTGVGVTRTKEEYKEAFSQLLGDIYEKTKDFAIESSNEELEANVNHTTSEIFHMKDAEILPLATFMRDIVFTTELMEDETFITYEVTEQNITDAYELAENFNSKIGEAPSINVISETANVEINQIIIEIRAIIASLTRLIVHFRISNKTFFKGFYSASRRDDIGIRHTGINVTITLQGVGVKGGIVMVGKKSETSDITGKCHPIIVMQGSKEITCKLEGHTDKKIIHHFIRGHMDDMSFDF